MGRFLNRDPTGYAGRIGLYDYCNNQPNDFVDPSGEQAVIAPIIIVGVVVIGVAIWVMVNGVAHYAGQGGLDFEGCLSEVRGGNKLEPDPRAGGAHTVFRPGHYRTFLPNPNPPDSPNGEGKWLTEKRYDGEGSPHGEVECPHVHPRGKPCRGAEPGENMKGYK